MHYLDWENKVPFRYNKIFEGNIKINGKQKIQMDIFCKIPS